MTKLLFVAFLFSSIIFCNNKEIDEQAVKFKEILRLVDENYVDTVDLESLSEIAFKQMLQSLDNQSFYFNKEEYLKIKNQTSGSSEIGIGVSIEAIDDTIYVTGVVKNSPADSLGLRSGDVIIFVDGKSLIGVSKSEAKKILKGKPETTANIIYKTFIKRELKEINVPRKKTPVSTVETNFLLANSGIGYLKVRTFSNRTSTDLKDSLKLMKKNGMKRLILDLRNNEGGILDEGVNSAGLFLAGKPVITKTESKNKIYDKKKTPNLEAKFPDIPLIILLNGRSASASEIFAGAMQDYDRAIVCGSVSMGKGTVQRAWEFKDSTAFRITISRWVTPSGRPVQLEKDVKISNMVDLPKELNNDLISAIKKFGIDRKKIYKSESGRNLIAVNGILPDKLVKEDTLTLLTKVMKQKNIFKKHAIQWVSLYLEEIKNQFGSDYQKFYEEYEINKECLDLLAKVLQDNNTFNQEMYNKDKFRILNLVKANIAKLIWGDKAFNYILIQLDSQVIAAIRNMDKAVEMVK